MLVNRYEAGSFRYLDTILTDVQGRQIGTNSFALPREYAVALPDATHFYAAVTSKVYSWIDGSLVWTGTAGYWPGGAITGSHLVLLLGEYGVEMSPWH